MNSIQGQLVGLLRTLQNVKESSEEKENSEHKNKVVEALETVTAIAPLISVVPDVVSGHLTKNHMTGMLIPFFFLCTRSTECTH